jgi:hypothetical protein
MESRPDGGTAPMITNSEDVLGTIYETKDLRKFTFALYGGFDGWDIYRTSRTTGDEYKLSRYKGKLDLSTGIGEHFDIIRNASELKLPQKGITSDYYAFWAGFMQFDNSHETPINVFATPGIDYVNDRLLVGEAIDMIESPTNQTAIYIVTTPDKPFGATDAIASIYGSFDAAGNMDAVNIDSSYTATYYPWCRYFDPDAQQSIFLPVTRDVVRSIASIDNTSFAWYPPAGDERGRVNCQSARYNLRIQDEDNLLNSRINPIKTYAQDGVYIWGQKVMKVSYYEDTEPLTRVGVRRMMLRIRNLVLRANRKLIFTPNDATLANKFKANCSAILNDVKQNRGISDYKIIVNDSQEARDNRTLPATILIKPINMLEYIEINFVIAGAGIEIADLV